MSAGSGEIIASGALPLALGVAVLAGVISFASPCVLPLVPGFLGYVTGLSEVALEQRSRGRLVLGALLFVLGFTAVFIAIFVLGSTFTTVIEHRVLLLRLGGVLVLAMGVVFVLGRGTRALRVGWRPRAGLAGAPVLGAVFGLGWAPCTGPALAAILSLASSLDPSPGRATALAVAYSLGLGIPLVLIAGGVERWGRVSGWLRHHDRLIRFVGGGVLVVVGLLMVTGLWEELNRWVQSRLVDGFEVVI